MPASESIRASVKDEGVGMPPEIISERLLVLFRSTKEADDSKIGKFGVGFASVLALDPRLVKVTSAHDGASHALHLFPDLSYELFETGPTRRCGTTVEIEVALAADRARDFIDGLTLYETNEPFVGKLAFKVQDSRLGHTLSRDNVRCDRRFELALDFVRRLAERALRDAATDAIRRAAESGEAASFADAASAIARAELGLDRDKWPIPIAVPIDGKRTAPLEIIIARGGYGHGDRSPITERLATLGVPVALKGRVSREVESLIGASLADSSALTMVTPRQATAHQREVFEATLALLDIVHRSPAGLVIADVEGARSAQPFLTCKSDEVGQSFFVGDNDADRNPFALFRRRAIAINARTALAESILAPRSAGSESPLDTFGSTPSGRSPSSARIS